MSSRKEREIFLSRAHGWIPFKDAVSQLFSQNQSHFALKATDAKCVAASTEMWSVWVWPIPCFRLIGLDQQCQRECECTWSDPRKRSETPVSMNRLTPLPLPTSGGVLVGLAVLCLSGLIGLTCSPYMILSTQQGQTSALRQLWEVLLFSTICSECIYSLQSSSQMWSWGQPIRARLRTGPPFSNTLLSEKDVWVSHKFDKY